MWGTSTLERGDRPVAADFPRSAVPPVERRDLPGRLTVGAPVLDSSRLRRAYVGETRSLRSARREWSCGEELRVSPGYSHLRRQRPSRRPSRSRHRRRTQAERREAAASARLTPKMRLRTRLFPEPPKQGPSRRRRRAARARGPARRRTGRSVARRRRCPQNSSRDPALRLRPRSRTHLPCRALARLRHSPSLARGPDWSRVKDEDVAPRHPTHPRRR
jgi:hypothetical protein